MNLDNPAGWQQVPIAGAGGEPDGNTLVSYVLQMQILDNHQNGKDTHLRGIKIYAFDNEAAQVPGDESNAMDDVKDLPGDVDDSNKRRGTTTQASELANAFAMVRGQPSASSAFDIPDFMREPEIR